MLLTRGAPLRRVCYGAWRGFGGEAAQQSETMDHLAYCAAQVRQHDYSSFLCTVALPSAHRPAAFAVRAFMVETAQAIDAAREPNLAVIRLTWWRDTIGRALDPAQPAPAHPVARALRAAAQAAPLGPADAARARTLLERVVAARISDAEMVGLPPSLEAMEVYARASSGSALEATLALVGRSSPAAQRAAGDVGLAMGLTALLAGARAHGARGRFYLPADVAKAEGLRAEALRKAQGGEPLRRTAAAVAAAAEAALGRARAARAALPEGAAGVLLPAVPARIYLRALAAAGGDVFADSLALRGGVVSPMRLQTEIAWAAMTGRF